MSTAWHHFFLGLNLAFGMTGQEGEGEGEGGGDSIKVALGRAGTLPLDPASLVRMQSYTVPKPLRNGCWALSGKLLQYHRANTCIVEVQGWACLPCEFL